LLAARYGAEKGHLREGQWVFLVEEDCVDPWRSRGYSVRGTYQLLTSQQSVTLDVVEDLLWHKKVRLEGVYFFLETFAR
jgi:hypothetical protein